MKYIVLVGDGMSGWPLDELNGRTTLEVSNRPFMDEIAKAGKLGTAVTIPRGMTPASDVANLSIIGYDPEKYYSGRGPLEAANIGVSLREHDVVFRCNLVTEADGKIVDYSAGHITTKEARLLIERLNKTLGTERIRFYPGISYRHLLVIHAASSEEALQLAKIKCMPPHDILDEGVSKNLPHGKQKKVLTELIKKSKKILAGHDINKVRIDLKENPGNMIWLWGQGIKPSIPPFKELYGVEGSIISAVDLIKGIGKIIGLNVVDVPGATGYYDTNYQGKGEYALKALEEKDFVFVHVEAPDEAGHNGDIREKISAIENFDRFVVGTIWRQYKSRGDFRILVLPDHATPIAKRTHTADPIPFVICGRGIKPDGACVFTEPAARATRFNIGHGHLLMKYLIQGQE
jgi:2,3-bisphosphoglycerate-independent phosphoglycerate mutase